LLIFLGAQSYSKLGLAHPVSFKGSLGIMTFNSPKSTEHYINYSVTHRWAPTLRFFENRDAQGEVESRYLYPQLSFLLKRWNRPASQGNLYFSAGYGSAWHKNNNAYTQTGSHLIDIEADWEDRSYYVSAKAKFQDIGDQEYFNDAYRFRIGHAPYKAAFDELNTWLIYQEAWMPQSEDQVTRTLLMRMFYRNILFELGAQFDGKLVFNFMTHI
jgi:hypothetical protein